MSGKTRFGQLDVRQRMLVLARRLYEGETLSSDWIEKEFSVCGRSARLDLAMLAMYLPCEQDRLAREGKGNRYKTVRLARRLPRFER